MASPLQRASDRNFAIFAILAPCIVAFLVGLLGAIFRWSGAPVTALTIAALGSVVTMNLLVHRVLATTKQYADETQWAIKRHVHAVPVGSAAQALDYISARAPALRKIRNTSFNMSDNLDIVEAAFYNSPSYRAFREAIANSCASDLVCTDVGDRHAVPRFRELRELCAAAGGADRYMYRILSAACPHMNFIILDYKENLSEQTQDHGRCSEVLFNWDFRSNEGDPVVYMSTDRDLVSMYSVHFSTMYSAASPDHDATSVA